MKIKPQKKPHYNNYYTRSKNNDPYAHAIKEFTEHIGYLNREKKRSSSNLHCIFNTQIKKSEETLEQLKKKKINHEKIEIELRTFRDDKAYLKRVIHQKNATIEMLKEENQFLLSETNTLTLQITEQSKAFCKLNDEYLERINKIEELQVEINRLKLELDTLTTNNEQLTNQVKDFQITDKAKDNEILKLTNEIFQMQIQVDQKESRDENEKFENQIKCFKNMIIELQEEINDLKLKTQ